MIIQTNGYLEEYAAKCFSGEIIAGEELKAELRNLIREQAGTEYTYDTSAADERIDFIENCVKLTKSPFYGLPMRLMLWQKAFISALYGFWMPDGSQRFKKALLLIARKNGKSEFCSALGLADFVLGNEGSDIVTSSNDDTQASILYDAIDLMRKMIDPEDLDTKRNQRFILNKVSNTKIFKMSERTHNKEGRNIDDAFQDEAHELKTNEIPKAIEQSQSLKINPKFIILTTEGFIQEGYLDEELDTARKIIAGEDDTQAGSRELPWLYTQDSEQEIFTDERSWYKSNPSLGIIKRWDYLREQVEKAKQRKTDRIYVLTKDFNVKQNGAVAWLAMEDYTYPATFEIEDLRGCFCIGEVDLAQTTDLTCAMAMVLSPDGRTKYIMQHYFIPERKLDPENDDRGDGARYKEWAKKGLLTVSEGNETNLAQVAEWFYNLQKTYGIKLYKCGYDQRFAKEWIAAMENYGWSAKYGDIEMIWQNAETLTNAINLVEADLQSRYINYNENEITRWCLSNACLKTIDKQKVLIIKTKNEKKIDGAVTMASLFELYRRYKSDLINLAGRGAIGGKEANGNP